MEGHWHGMSYGKVLVAGSCWNHTRGSLAIGQWVKIRAMLKCSWSFLETKVGGLWRCHRLCGGQGTGLVSAFPLVVPGCQQCNHSSSAFFSGIVWHSWPPSLCCPWNPAALTTPPQLLCGRPHPSALFSSLWELMSLHVPYSCLCWKAGKDHIPFKRNLVETLAMWDMNGYQNPWDRDWICEPMHLNMFKNVETRAWSFTQ